MIKLDGEVKTQVDLQKRLTEQLETKYKNQIGLEDHQHKSDELAYDQIDTFNVEDMKDKIETLERTNGFLQNEKNRLKEEDTKQRQEVDKAFKNCDRVRNEVEDKMVREEVERKKDLQLMDKEIDIMGKKYLEVNEKNADLESKLMRLRDQHDESEREQNAQKRRFKNLKEEEKKREDQRKDDERKAMEELKSQQNRENMLDLNLRNLENELARLQDEKNLNIRTLEEKKKEKEEWERAWRRVEDSFEVLNGKRDAYKKDIEDYQNRYKEAEEKKSQVLRRQDEWQKQKKELREQFQQRQVQMRKNYEKENKRIEREVDTVMKEKEDELKLLRRRKKALEADNFNQEKNVQRLKNERKVVADLEKGESSKEEMICNLRDKLRVLNENVKLRESEVAQCCYGKEDLERIRNEKIKLSDEVYRLKSEKSSLDKALEETKFKKNNIDTDLNATKAKFTENMKVKVTAVNRQTKDLQDEIDRVREEDTHIKLELANLFRQGEVEEQRVRATLESRREEWERLISDKSVHILELRKRIHGLATK